MGMKVLTENETPPEGSPYLRLDVDLRKINDFSPENTRSYAAFLTCATQHFISLPPPCENPLHIAMLNGTIHETLDNWLSSIAMLLTAPPDALEKAKDQWQRDLFNAEAAFKLKKHLHPGDEGERAPVPASMSGIPYLPAPPDNSKGH